MHFWSILNDVGLILTAALILGAIAIRFGLSPIIGYLLAGMFLGGAGSLHLIQSPTEIASIAELGVSLLLFSLGLEFSWQELKKFPTSTLKAGILQIIITPLVVLGISSMLDIDYRLGVLIALMITLSSTATVLRTLMELTEIDSVHGRYSTAILLLQDIAVVPFTIIVSLVCAGAGTGLPKAIAGAAAGAGIATEAGLPSMLITIAGAAALVLGLYVIINKIANPVLSMFSLENNREMGILLAAISGIGSAWAAHRIGLSPAIGAFIAGMLLGSSKFATQIRADVAPLKIIFLTLFFGTAGMIADPHWIMNNFVLVLSLTALVMAFKTVLTVGIFRLCCNSFSVAVASGLCISQIGEFAFVLSSIAYKAHVLETDIYQLIVSVTIFSIFVTPFVVKAAPIVGLKLQRFLFKNLKNELSSKDANLVENLVFILGFGPAAREIVRHLRGFDLKLVVIDLNQECVARAKEMGLEAHIGDIRQLEVLKHYNVQQAKLVLVTVPGHAAAIQAIYNARRLAPHIKVIARSRYHENVADLLHAGAHEVIDEEVAVGKGLGKTVMKMLGLE